MKEYDFQLSSFDIFNITKEMGNETVNNEKNRIKGEPFCKIQS